MTKMNPAIKALWVYDLRTTEHKQNSTFLNCSAGFCCLGRLTDLYIQSPANTNNLQWIDKDYGIKIFGHSSVHLSNEILDWSGLKNREGAKVLVPKHLKVSTQIRERGVVTLSLLNDHGLTFRELADIIEEQL